MNATLDIVRAVWIDGASVPAGARVSVGEGLAAELISAGKAVRAAPRDPVPAAAPSAEPESSPPAPGRRRPRAPQVQFRPDTE
jgi:hypothetical protein